MTTILCHYCELDVTDGRNHDCPYIGICELQKNVADAAVNAICGSGSITSECRRDAAALVLAYAQFAGTDVLDRNHAQEQLEKAYRYFEFSEPLPPVLEDCLNRLDDNPEAAEAFEERAWSGNS